MKWFKHLTSAYTDIAIRQVIEEYGTEGYGLFFLCCELVGQQGKNFRLKKSQNWLKILELVSKIPEKKLSEVLQKFSELNLIDKVAYKKGDLFLVKMSRYADEWTTRTREKLGSTPEKLGLDKIRIDKNRLYREIKKKPFFNGQPMIKDYGKWYVLEKGGKILFTGNEKEIVYK